MLTLDNSLDNVDTLLVYSIANRKQCSVVLRRGIIVVLGKLSCRWSDTREIAIRTSSGGRATSVYIFGMSKDANGVISSVLNDCSCFMTIACCLVFGATVMYL